MDPSLASPSVARLAGVTVAFDLDGTLVDTAPDLVGALNAVLDECRLPALPFATARVMVGRGARALIEQGFAAAGEPLRAEATPALLDRFITLYRDRIALESRVFPGVVASLETLAETGAVLAVCTNKRTDLSLALLDALDLTRHFAAVIGSDLSPAAKPDARHLQVAIEAAGGAMDRAVLVGDSANDVGAARAAGAPSIVVDFGYTQIPAADLGADHVIGHFDELHGVIDHLFACGPAPGKL